MAKPGPEMGGNSNSGSGNDGPGRKKKKRRGVARGGRSNAPLQNSSNNNKRRKRSNADDEKGQNHKEGGTTASSSRSSSNNVTPNAIRKLLLAEPYEGPLVVALQQHTTTSTTSTNTSNNNGNDKFVPGQIWDHSFVAPCLIPRDFCAKEIKRKPPTAPRLVRITGYVTSTVNAAGSPQSHFEPFLCLTQLEEVISITSSTNSIQLPPLTTRKLTATTSHEKIQGGRSAAVLEDYLLPHLSMEDMAGASRVAFEQFQGEHDGEVLQNKAIVEDFLTHHKAMTALKQSKLMMQARHSSSNTTNESTASATETTTTTTAAAAEDNTNNNSSNSNTQAQHNNTPQHELYFAALKEFATAQVDRQKASLSSNAGRATAEDATKVIQQHKECLEQVMTAKRATTTTTTTTPWITVDNLQKWHGQLCGNGLHPQAGQWRTHKVKAGRTSFCDPSQLLPQLQDTLLPALYKMEQQQQQQLSTTNNNASSLSFLTVAAAVFFGVVDLHPFADGNGRLARILGNGALQLQNDGEFAIPFCIHWFATPQQRSDYILATHLVRRNLQLVYRGEHNNNNDNTKDRVVDAFRASGVYFPLVSLLLDRIRKAIQEFVELQHQKQLSALEHAEAVAARRVRERAATGSCLICLDDHPNIATLCCGRAVHLNCLAEWLSDNHSCPNCRGTMPALLPRRPRQQQQQQQHQPEPQQEQQRQSLVDIVGQSVREGIRAALRNSNSTTTTSSDTEIDDDDDIDELEDLQGTTTEDTTTDEDAEDTTTVVVTNNSNNINNNNNSNDTTEEDGTEEDTTEDTTTMEDSSTTESVQDDSGTTDDTTTNDEIEEDGTTTMEDDSAASTSPPPPPSRNRGNCCLFCNNRPAQECANQCCGRCCLLHGAWQCFRHSG